MATKRRTTTRKRTATAKRKAPVRRRMSASPARLSASPARLSARKPVRRRRRRPSSMKANQALIKKSLFTAVEGGVGGGLFSVAHSQFLAKQSETIKIVGGLALPVATMVLTKRPTLAAGMAGAAVALLQGSVMGASPMAARKANFANTRLASSPYTKLAASPARLSAGMYPRTNTLGMKYSPNKANLKY